MARTHSPVQEVEALDSDLTLTGLHSLASAEVQGPLEASTSGILKILKIYLWDPADVRRETPSYRYNAHNNQTTPVTDR